MMTVLLLLLHAAGLAFAIFNFGYNTRDVTILAFAVLTAGLVVAARQEMDLPASGWAVLGPLLAFRALYDFSSALAPLRNALE